MGDNPEGSQTVRDRTDLHKKYTGNMQNCTERMPDLHKKELMAAQKSTISHSADAHGGFPPSSTASAVPLWRFLTFTLKRALDLSGGPLFLPAIIFRNSPEYREIQPCFATAAIPYVSQLPRLTFTRWAAVPLWRFLTFKLSGRGEI
ncbi:hypothetical protein [Agrobacterium tumefaciens]|uniref:hypothetical protein n=1 Tax=Agrobacterium tumefaciens TaxID=358 RepID=UPI00287DE938|nr:hypothetical protein [Agrobacterium tumefaciens]MDS7597613.1 hypothetical protein [Agrobacterium tumefaciens]